LDSKDNEKINTTETLEEEINEFFDKSKYVSVGEKKITGNIREWFENRSKIISSKLELVPKLFVIYFVNLLKGYTVQDEDKCWQYLFKKHYGYSNPNIKYTEFYDYLKDAFAKSKYALFKIKGRNLYYQTLAFHAFAPIESFESFLDVLWNIHLTRLDDTYFDEDYDDIVDAFINFFLKSDDEESEVYIGSKSYNIKAGLKYFALCDKNGFKNLVKKCSGLISLYYDKTGQSKEDTYLIDLFNNWWKKQTKETSNIEKKYREPTVRDYNDVNIKYTFDNSKGIIIQFPQLRIKNSDLVPKLQLYCGSQLIQEKILDTHGNGFLRVVLPFDVNISDLELYNLNIKIVINLDGIIFDSKEGLYRDLIIFNNGNEVLNKNLNIGVYSIFCLEEFDKYFHGTCFLYQNIENIYNVNCNIGDDFSFCNNFYHIYDENKKNPNNFEIVGTKLQGVSFFDKNEELPIYGSNFSIRVANAHEYNVLIDNRPIMPLNLALQNNLFCNCNNIVTIKKAITNEVVFRTYITTGLDYQFEKPFYYNQNELSYLNYNNKKTSFYSNVKNLSFYIKRGKLSFHIPRISWKIENITKEEQFNILDKYIWYKDIRRTTNLELKLPYSVATVMVAINNKILNAQDGKYFLGEYLFRESFIEEKELTVWMKINNASLKVCSIITQPIFSQDPQLFYQDGFLRVSIFPNSFVGPTDREFVYKLENENININFNEQLKEINLPLGAYKFSITCKYDRNPFTDVCKEKTIYENKFLNGKPEEIRFLNKILSIETLVDFTGNEVKIRKSYLIKNLQFDKNIYGFDNYKCDIYVYTYDERQFLVHKDAEIEIIDDEKCLLLFLDEYEFIEFELSKSTGRFEKKLQNRKDGQELNYIKYKINKK